jgi:two-component system alkaline phosphatase synthesis response regulator PhoP
MAKKKILIVDDEAELVELAKTHLESCGYDVVPANGGLEGLSKATQEHPDLIILDIAMPDLDGYSTLQRIKMEEGLKDIPVIMLTAKAQMKSLFEMEGVSDYIVKPFDFPDFLARVGKALKKGK